MNPFSSGTRLRDMIRSIRACKTAAEERAVVRKECAAIRAAISENDQDYRHRNLAKLMFIHMLGYPTHFGQMECLKSIASPGFPEKRIGYLGLMLLLDERQEVLMLVTNSIKQDLNHTNQYIVGLALCALGNICSAEMARDLAPEVERLLQFRDPNIRKKAALCTIRIIRKVPDLAENFINSAASLLKEKHHGVLLTGVQLCTDLCKISSEALEYFRKKCTEGVVKVLKDLANSPYAPEYDIAGITDPFLHIRLLKFLRVLGQGDVDTSDCMNDILAQVATKTESNKNAGNAILYECVATIMSIEDNGGLRVLAINILGRFLSNRDNNIRYVALNMLMRAITVDSQAVQRHRATILECVKDSDASIRKRALELVYLLVNESNVKPLTKELIDYLEVSEPEFRGDLTAKICSIVEKFSPEKIWYIDQMLKVLSEGDTRAKGGCLHRIQALFYWPGIKQDVITFVRSCDVCQRSKHEEDVSYPELLQPIPVPQQAWSHISMDFIEQLPLSHGFDTILVAVDRLTKFSHFIRLTHPFTAQQIAQVFLDQVYRLHGLPESAISDRDKIFVSRFWHELFQLLGVGLHYSSSYHPQSDGQSERVNQCLENYLRCMCSEHPSHWSNWLLTAEFWYTTNFHTSLQITPFEALYGYKPNHIPLGPFQR